jgi:DNA-binding NarL/FixJ family response regulator
MDRNDNGTAAIRILLVDDHPIVREGLAAIIERRPDMTVVAEAGSGTEAVERFREHLPDVTLMDLRLPEMDGVAAIQAIRREFGEARILVLTTYDGDEDIYRAMRAGAKGYLLKDSRREYLLEAIHTVNAGRVFLPGDVATKLSERLVSQDVTPREREVLQLIAKGMSNSEIGSALFISEGTVKGHVVNLLEKLEAHDRTQAVTNALKRGIIHIE